MSITFPEAFYFIFNNLGMSSRGDFERSTILIVNPYALTRVSRIIILPIKLDKMTGSFMSE